MANLKLKLKFNTLEFEIEGEENVVREEFEKFKGFLATEFVNRAPAAGVITSEGGEQFLLDNGGTDNFPILLEVVKKDLPGSESEWVLIYAFYSSNFGQEFFSEQNIKSKYESTARKNKSRLANLSNNIKTLLNKDYIKLHNDTQYLFLDKGREVVIKILNGERKQAKKTPARKNTTSKINEDSEKKPIQKTKKVDYQDFEYSTEQIKSLRDYFKSKRTSTQTEEVLVVMKWNEELNNGKGLSIKEIAYMMDICSSIPSALNQVLVNAKGSRYRWIKNVTGGTDVQLTTTGRLHVDEKLGISSANE